MQPSRYLTSVWSYYYGLGNIYGDSKRDYFARSNHSNIVVKLAWLFDIR